MRMRKQTDRKPFAFRNKVNKKCLDSEQKHKTMI